MKTEEIEFFVHGAGRPVVASGTLDEPLRDALIRAGALQEEDARALIFVGECEQAINEALDVEDGADKHEPADPNLTLRELGVKRHHHVHIHRCRIIAVQVNFTDKLKRRRFSPATTIAVVTGWARRKFRIDAASAAEFVLQICGTQDQPRPDTHLGELTKEPECSLCFDLVKEVTPQG